VGRIVVVDNASEQADRENLERVTGADDRIDIVLSEENRGFAAAANLGVRNLAPDDEDVVVLLNPDTRVLDGALTALAGALAGGTFDVVSPVIYTDEAEQSIVWFAGGHLDLRRGESIHLGYGRTAPVEQPDAAITFVTGAAPATTGRTWRELGGFREDLFLYWEDVDLSLRATACGKRLGVVGARPSGTRWAARGIPRVRASRSTTTCSYMQRNRIIVLRPIVGLRRLLVGAGAWFVLRVTGYALLEPRGRWRKAGYTLLGLYDGIRGKTGPRVLKP
jgi:N-acetylglucosaminyl-diphospho-decaprenol L-rhamnosyltransferase